MTAETNGMYAPEAIHVALDLETLGTRPGSKIIQIGAQAFTLSGKVIAVPTDAFDVCISPDLEHSAGFLSDQATVTWWNNQDPAIRREVFSGTTSPFQALTEFYGYLKKLGPKDSIYIWGNSPRFDCGLLQDHYQHYAMDIPWEFRNERDFRTLTALFPQVTAAAKTRYTNEQPHNGYWDARWEADIIKFILQEEPI